MKTHSKWMHALCALVAAGLGTSSFAKDKKHDDDRDHHSSSKGRGHHVEKSDRKPSGPSSGPRLASQSRPDMNRRPSPSPSAKPEPKREAPRIAQHKDGPRPDFRHRDEPDRHDRDVRRPGVLYSGRPEVFFGLRPVVRVPVYPGTAYGVSVADIQRALARRGFYYGAIDGDFGPMTSRAIAAFQDRAGLAVTGEINASLARALGF